MDRFEHDFEFPKQEIADICSVCGYEIPCGETYYSFQGEAVCEECLPEYLDQYKKEGE